MVVRGSAWLAASWTPRNGTPASKAAVMKACRSVWGPASHPPDDAGGGVAVETLTVASEEDRPFATLTDGQVDSPGGTRREGDGDDLASLPQHHEGAMPPLERQGLDIGAAGFGDPQPVERQQ